MIFDGGTLNLNDSVYDVAYGSGSVIEINDVLGTFRVNFAGRTFTYNLSGIGTFPRKTLYWREPIGGYIPQRDQPFWDKFVEIRRVAAQVLSIGVY